MMRLEHIAIWTPDIDRLASFYERYFGAKPGAKYVNEAKRFQSYFLEFSSGARLELMQRPDIESINKAGPDQEFTGYAHIAISLGSEEAVDTLTERLVNDGYERLDGPRRTGDGYYESVILDVDGNRIEITA